MLCEWAVNFTAGWQILSKSLGGKKGKKFTGSIRLVKWETLPIFRIFCGVLNIWYWSEQSILLINGMFYLTFLLSCRGSSWGSPQHPERVVARTSVYLILECQSQLKSLMVDMFHETPRYWFILWLMLNKNIKKKWKWNYGFSLLILKFHRFCNGRSVHINRI